MEARLLALEELLRFERAGQYADRTLDTALSRDTALSPQDRALVTVLFYGVIERRITLDAVIDALSAIPPSAIELRVRMILRMGLYQLKYLDRVPDHAAINEAVGATPRRSKGFVNALLRAFCRGGKQIPLRDRREDPVGYLSVKYSVSSSVAESFLSAFGMTRAESLLTAFSTHVPIGVRVNTLKLTREEFLSRVPDSVPMKNAPFGVLLKNGALLHELIGEGLCFVQDEASQIAVEALDAVPLMRVLDLCAAPGSKSFGAGLAMRNRGVLRSFDLHANKLSLIRDGAQRLGLSILEAEVGDARLATPATHGLFDRVICDVPCSGLGVLAKKPDIRYKNMQDAAGLLPVQAAILSAAASCVAPGGVLLYSTCTLVPAENEEQVYAFLKEHDDFAKEPFSVGGITSDGMLTLTPDRDGTDGFFMARLRRRQEDL
ncbi:MAG: 16S rRNA (cytosine(967)-C(5))-methyltransferase RsmB [Ruminococcaceae bacterium]|nr:16S rRNA (cytosine(967)-C(5))-methyltransferase RsmB [Oscillospiraceae bacterium]